MKRNDKRPMDISRAGGMSISILVRILRGKQTFISTQEFAKLEAGLARTNQDKAELLRARLLDVAAELPHNDLVEVVIRGAPRKKAETPELALSPELSKALEHLRALSLRKPDVSVALITLAKLTGMAD